MRERPEPLRPFAPDDPPTPPAPPEGRNLAPPLRSSRDSYASRGTAGEAAPLPSPLTDPVPSGGLVSPFRLPVEIEDGWAAGALAGRPRP